MRRVFLAIWAASLSGCGPNPQLVELQQMGQRWETERLERERQEWFLPRERDRVIVQFAAETVSNDPDNTYVRGIRLRRNSPDDRDFDFCAESYRRNRAGYIDNVETIFGEHREAGGGRTIRGALAAQSCQVKIYAPKPKREPISQPTPDGWHPAR